MLLISDFLSIVFCTLGPVFTIRAQIRINQNPIEMNTFVVLFIYIYTCDIYDKHNRCYVCDKSWVFVCVVREGCVIYTRWTRDRKNTVGRIIQLHWITQLPPPPFSFSFSQFTCNCLFTVQIITKMRHWILALL